MDKGRSARERRSELRHGCTGSDALAGSRGELQAGVLRRGGAEKRVVRQ